MYSFKSDIGSFWIVERTRGHAKWWLGITLADRTYELLGRYRAAKAAVRALAAYDTGWQTMEPAGPSPESPASTARVRAWASPTPRPRTERRY
jgi:hypothetical protein